MKKYSILRTKSINFAILLAIIFAFAFYSNGFAAQNLRDIAARQQTEKGVASVLEIILEEGGEEACLAEMAVMLDEEELSIAELMWLEEKQKEGKISREKFAGFLARIASEYITFRSKNQAEIKELEEASAEQVKIASTDQEKQDFMKELSALYKFYSLARSMQISLASRTGNMKMMARGEELARRQLTELAGEAAESVKPRILVIDDDPGILQVFEVMLKKSCTVETAKNGQEGVDKFEGDSFDLVITDMNTLSAGGHKDDGYRVATALQGKVPVVLMSGNSPQALEDAAASGLFADVISKPISVKPLRDKVRSVLARSQSGIEEKLKAAIPVLAYTPKAADLDAGTTMAAIVDAEILAQSAPEAKLALAKLDEIVGKRNIRILDLSSVSEPDKFLAAAGLSIKDFQIIITANDLSMESKFSGVSIDNKAELIMNITRKVLWTLKDLNYHVDLNPHIQNIVGRIFRDNPQFADMVRDQIDLNNIHYGAIVPSNDAERWRALAKELILTILAYDIQQEQGYASFAEAAVGLGEAVFNGGELPPHVIDMTNARLQKKDGYIGLAPRSTLELGTELQKAYEDSRKALDSV